MSLAIEHLIILPVLLPLATAALMVPLDERRRTLKAAISVVSTLGSLWIAFALLGFADARPPDAGSAANVYLLGNWPAPFGIVLVVVFFVTSSDSGSLVIDTITAGGKVDAPVAQRVFWAIFEGLVAVVLLLAGGLAALQAAAITTGIPFALVLLGMCVAIWKGLSSERAALRSA